MVKETKGTKQQKQAQESKKKRKDAAKKRKSKSKELLTLQTLSECEQKEMILNFSVFWKLIDIKLILNLANCIDININNKTNCLCGSLKNWGGVTSSDWVIISLFSLYLIFAPKTFSQLCHINTKYCDTNL